MASPPAQLPDTRKSVTNRTLDHEDGLYRHTKRPEWGVAILAWEKGGRRAYQFEDGRMRIFREGYYSLMKPVDEVPGSEEALVADLESAVAAHNGGAKHKPLEPVCTFEEQVSLFEELFPGGFQGDEWIERHRRGQGRALKRHREPVLERAQELLSQESLQQSIEGDRQGHLAGSVLGILQDTDLVPVNQVRGLKGMEPPEKNRFVESLDFLLYGEEAFGQRFKGWVATLEAVGGGKPSWRLATVIPALVFPNEHVCVRRSSFIRQAAIIAPAAKYSRRPKRRSYRNFRRVARAARKRLSSAGHEARDLLDVHDFGWVTLRNAALTHLKGD